MIIIIVYLVVFVLISVLAGLFNAEEEAVSMAFFWPLVLVMLIAVAPYFAARALGRWISRS